MKILSELPELEPAEERLRTLADVMGYSVGQVFGIIRVAVTGQKVSPPLFESMAIIGRRKSVGANSKCHHYFRDT